MKRVARLLAAVIVALATVRVAAQTAPVVTTVEDRDHVAIAQLQGVYDHQPESSRAYELAVRQAVAKEFLRTHGDDYDFVVAFTKFPFALGSDSDGSHVGGRYYPIKNDVLGIGQPQFDASADWGSQGRLQGYIDMGPLASLATDPTDPKFEQTLSILAHELAHRWVAHVKFRDENGSPSGALLGRDGAHWSFLLQSHNSVMYGQDWRDNADGTFTSVGRTQSYYSPLDLYLMGVLDKSEVPPFFLLQSPGIAPERLPELGVTIPATARPITIDDVIAAEGDRVPGAAAAPKRFKIGFLFLVAPGQTATGRELNAINTVRDAFATRTSILTGGKSVVEVFPDAPDAPLPAPPPILPPGSGPSSGPVDLDRGLTWLLARQTTAGSWADSPWTQVRDTSAAIELVKTIPGGLTSRDRALGWLVGLGVPANVDIAARRAAALAPQFPVADSSFLTDAANTSGGWGLAAGYASDPIDTALVLTALPSPPNAAATVSRLIAMQNADGGWGAAPSAPSSLTATAAVVRALGGRSDTGAAAAIERALAWISARQHADGGFGDGGSTADETAEAALLLMPTTFPRTEMARALTYLGARQLADGSWNESIYETALALRALRAGSLANLTVSAAHLSNLDPVDGASLTVSATLSNTGGQDVTNAVVRVFDGDPAAGGVAIGAPTQIALLPAFAVASVTATWDTTGKPGPHTIFVVADPDNAVDEANERDNVQQVAVVVRAAPAGTDLVISNVDLAFSPSTLRGTPQPQTVTVRVTNPGLTAAPNAAVRLFDGAPGAGGAAVGSVTINVPARGSATATFTFTVDRAGEHVFHAFADPDNVLAETDETNNHGFAALPVDQLIDLFVDPPTLALSPNPVGIGQDLSISVVVGNRGTVDAFNVPVRFSVDDPAGAIAVASPTVDLPAGSSKTVSAVWRTSRALAAVPVSATVDPANAFDESSETNNRASAPLTVTASTLPNLVVSSVDLQIATPVRVGESTALSIPVRNTGTSAAPAVTVSWFLGCPGSGGTLLSSETLASIPAGGQAQSSATWTPGASGNALVCVAVDQTHAIAEFDEDDNVAFRSVKVLSRPDLVITSAAIDFAPAFPKDGDPVTVSATVANSGEQDAVNVRVRVLAGGAAPVQIGSDQVLPIVPALGAATVHVPLGAVQAGTREIVVQVDPLGEIVEASETNNSATRTLGVQNGSMFLSNIYFSPNGDGVRDDTQLFFRFNAPQSVSAAVVFDRLRKKVRTLPIGGAAMSDGSVVWNGLDDNGRVVPDGGYDITVMSGDNRELGSARTLVDNNNSPVAESIGTKYLIQNNLTCGNNQVDVGYGYYQTFVTAGWLPDDSGLVRWYQTAVVQQQFGVTFSSTPVGVYVIAPDGQSVRITPDSWTVHPPAGKGTHLVDVQLSPDGSKVLIAAAHYSVNFGQQIFDPSVEYWTVNTDGSGLTLASTTPADAWIDAPYFYQVQQKWAPDSQRFAFEICVLSGYSITECRIYVARADGSARELTTTVDEINKSLDTFEWAPDSQRLLVTVLERIDPLGYAYRLYAMRPDGSGSVVVLTSGPGVEGVYWLGADRFVAPIDGELQPAGYFDWGGDERLWYFTLSGDPPRLVSSVGFAEVIESPNHDALAFTSNSGESGPLGRRSGGVWIVDASGAAEQLYQATAANQGLEGVKWSPDGRKLGFIENVAVTQQVCDQPPNSEGGGPQFCGDVAASVGVIDRVEHRTTLQPLADAGPERGYFEAVGFTADGASFLFQNGNTGTLDALSLTDGTVATVLDDPYAQLWEAKFSPSGKFFLYKSYRDSQNETGACWAGAPTSDDWTLTSLLNLTSTLGFKRENGQLVLQGIAEDRNFAHYQLEFATAEAPDSWMPIGAPSDTPVDGGELARWIPPSEGTFYVRLRAEDLAGNVSTSRKRLTWGLTPSITNVNVTPRVFAPNGDGVRDSATFDYVVLGPVHLDFRFYDQQNHLVRTLSQDHLPGPASIAWDGRDEDGRFVADGIYRVQVLNYDFFLTVDTAGPSVALAIGPGYHETAQIINCATPTACAPTPGPFVEQPYYLLAGHVTDDQLAEWTLEAGRGANPSEWLRIDGGKDPRGAGTSVQGSTLPADAVLQRFDRVTDVFNLKFRLTAVDSAGNRSTAVTGFVPEELILWGWDHTIVPTTRQIDQKLGPHVLSIVQTSLTAVTGATIQYRLHDTATWADGPAVPAGQSNAFDLSWDNAQQLAAGKVYDVRVALHAIDGRTLLSNAIAIRSDLFELTKIEDNLAIGRATLSENLSTITLVDGYDQSVGVGSIAGGPVDFRITIADNPALKPCTSETISVRFRGVGASGRVYYSNAKTAQRKAPPSMVSCGGGFGEVRSLDLAVVTAVADSCNTLGPGKVAIDVKSVAWPSGTQGVGQPAGADGEPLTISVQDVPNGPLRTLTVTTTPFHIVLDTAGRAEGTYIVKADSSTFGTATRTFVVDRALPTARITYPAGGQAVCPERATPSAMPVLPVEVIAEDPNIDRVVLEFGAGDAPAAWVPLVDRTVSAPIHGPLTSWSVPQLPSGTYTLRLRVFDKGGNVSCWTTTFVLQNGVRIQTGAVDRRVVSPNGDGQSDSVTVSYTLDRDGIIGAKVFALQGNGQPAPMPIRTIVANALQPAGANNLIWDGLADGGQPAADGRYVVVITAADGCGTVTDAAIPVIVDDTPPHVVITSPTASDALGIAVDVRGTASDLHFVSYQLQVAPASAPDGWVTIGTASSPVDNGLLGKWLNDGHAGQYTFRLTAIDAAGNHGDTLLPVTVAERTAIVTALSAPLLFSPNGDGRLDTATIAYSVADAAQITIEIVDSGGAIQRVLSSAAAVGAGSYQIVWDGRNSAGVVVEDGDYAVRLTAARASSPADTQVERSAVTVDTTPPQATIDAPGPGSFVRGNVLVSGAVSDVHVDTYEVSYSASGGAPSVAASGNQNHENGPFASLDALPDGGYTVTLHAVDRALNVVDKTVTFVVDNQAPQVAFVAPAAGALIGGDHTTVPLRGTIGDANVADWHLRYAASGVDPPVWTEIAGASSAPAADALGDWNLNGVVDGSYVLSLLAHDRAGAESEARITVTLDRTPPAAALSVPGGAGRIGGAVQISGIASDAHFKTARLEIAAGDPDTAYAFAPVADITAPVSGGALFLWQSLPRDGQYTLRLTVEDELGLTGESRLAVIVDTEPPSPPSNLTASVEARLNARLAWTAAGGDVAAYRIYRGGVPIATVPAPTVTFLDPNVADGTYRYTVTAIDAGALESGPTNDASVTIDRTAPTVRIASPAQDAQVSGLFEIRGTATAADLKEYRVFVGAGAPAAELTLIQRSPTPVVNALLAEYNAASAASGTVLTVRLEAEDFAGNVGADQRVVTVDNAIPAPPVLISAAASGSDATVSWQASVESDVIGVLLYNNDLLANARRIVTGALSPFALTGTSFVDRALPDGTYKYYAVAIDRAGNLSLPSNSITVTIDTRTPRAVIVQPADGTKVDGGVTLLATTPDLDVTGVQFQLRPTTTTTWSDLGPADTVPPYQARWEPAGLPRGSYRFRAVATDAAGHVDAAPPEITVVYQDLVAPVAPAQLTAAVTEANVHLTWSASASSDAHAYNVYRRRGPQTPQLITAAPVTTTSYDDAGVADGLYTYTVVAVDDAQNVSEPSSGADAHVYAPNVVVPNLCVVDPMTSVSGTGAEPSAIVSLYLDSGAGAVLAATAQASATGDFTFGAVPLIAAQTSVFVQAADVRGNVSRKSAAVAISHLPTPSAPSGFSATVTGTNVTLSWQPLAEPILGYTLYRSGDVLTGQRNVARSGFASASSRQYSSTRASNANDFQPGTYWQPSSFDSAPWWQLQFPAPILVREVKLDWFETLSAKDFDLQAWVQGSWTTIRAVRGNSGADDDIVSPVVTDRIRVLIFASNPGGPLLAEVGVIAQDFIAGSSYFDEDLADGRYSYQLKALNACAVEGPAAMADAAIGDVVAPDPPQNLTAAAVASDIALTWTASPSADLAGYRVYRLSGSEWVAVSPALVAATSFVDPLQPNGLHVYRVSAVDQSGNESAPSNQASAAIAVAPPSAPIQLAATAPPEGAAVVLTWQPGTPATPVAGYRVRRATTAGGPYSEATSSVVAALTYRDSGLVNGTQYFYRVYAVDAAGNGSADSNEASAVPTDVAPPQAPVLIYPTDAQHPVEVPGTSTPITGRSEPGATVTLLQDGVSLGTAAAVSGPDAHTMTFDGYVPGVNGVFAPAALIATFQQSAGQSPSQLAVVDAVSGRARPYPQFTDGSDPVFTRDGRTIAFIKSIGSTNQLVLFDRTTGTTTRTIPIPSGASSPAFSPDGGRIAFTANFQVFVADVATGTVRQLTQDSNFDFYPVWSADGTRIAYVNYTFTDSSIRLIDAATGTGVTVDAKAVPEPPSMSPDGTRMAFSSYRGGAAAVWLYDLASGTVTPLGDGHDQSVSASFSPDGREIVYLVPASANTWNVMLRTLQTGESRILDTTTGGAALIWLSDGSLLQPGSSQLRIVSVPGHFRFDDVPLPLPQNIFSAMATDSAGNSSVPAAPITLTRNTAALTDLAIADADLFVYPTLPAPGDVVRVSATIRNISSVPAANVEVAIVESDESLASTSIGPLRTIASLAPNQSATISADWATDGHIGRHTVRVVIDPRARLTEASRENNAAERTVMVAPPGVASVAVRTDKSSYTAGETVRVAVEAINGGAAGDFVLDVTAEDASGVLVTSLLHRVLPSFGATARSELLQWTPDVLAGPYRVHAALSRVGGATTDGTAGIAIQPDRRVTASVRTDRASYTAGDQVQIAGAITSLSTNANIADLLALIRIVDSAGVERFRHEETIPVLLLKSVAQIAAAWPNASVGSFAVNFSVQAGSETLAASQKTFEVTGAPRLTGTVTPSPSIVAVGSAFSVSAAATNAGTAPANGTILRLRVIDAEQQTEVRSAERNFDLNPAASVSFQETFTAAGLLLKPYKVLLQSERGGTVDTLASGTITVADQQAPTVAIVAPAPGGFYNADVAIDIVAGDDASGVARVEWQSGDDVWAAASPFDAAGGTYRTSLPATHDSEGVKTITVRAFDRAGNSESSSTTDANPVSVSFTIDVTPPAIEVTGVQDGATAPSPVTPVISITDANAIASQSLTLNGAPFVSGQSIVSAGDYILVARASDVAGNLATRTVSFAVTSGNRAPVATDVTLTTAEDTAAAVTLMASDPDHDALTFTWTAPAHGTLSGEAPNLTYLPAGNYFGPDAFTFSVSDGIAAAVSAQVQITVTAVNDRPVARVGADQAGSEGDLITLDGSLSSDPDGDTLTYQWSQIAGPTAPLDLTLPAFPKFVVPPVPAQGATLSFRLVVSDGTLSSEPALVNVTAKNVNKPPVAVAGPAQAVKEGTRVELDASASFDPDGDPLTFAWQQIDGPFVALTDGTTAHPTFIAPPVPQGSATVHLRVTVSDGLAQASDVVAITVEHQNHAPTADAGADQTRTEGATVTLNGGGSSDPDGDPLTYHWTQTAGPEVALSNAEALAPSFIAPQVEGAASLSFRLVVNDGRLDSAPDDVSVRVLNSNDPPACQAAQPSAGVLWPPDHKLIEIRIVGLTDPDNDAVITKITGVTQDELVNARGDGDTGPDAVLQGGSVLVRAERAEKGNGRVYRISFTATDAQGASCGGAVVVQVPPDQKPGTHAFDDGQRYDSTKP